MRRLPFVILVLLPLPFSIAGCSATNSATGNSGAAASSSPASAAPTTDRDAVIAAIQNHLHSNSGINMSAMDMTVGDVVVTGDKAQANAQFRVKQGGTSMQITYALERHAGNWIVLSDQPSGGQFQHPPMDKTHSGTGANPVGGAASGQPLPDVTDFLKNHPSVAQTSPQ